MHCSLIKTKDDHIADYLWVELSKNVCKMGFIIDLTLSLPIRIYTKSTFLYQIRIHAKSTCVHTLIAMEIFHAWLNIADQKWSVTWTQWSLAFLILAIAHPIAITCIV